MNYHNGLEQNLQQKIGLSYEMQQSMKVLQMSSVELLAHIHEEYLGNPVLELEKNEAEQPTLDDLDAVSFLDYLESSSQKDRNDVVDDYVSPLEFISKEITLTDHLLEQIHVMTLSETMENICEFIIYSLDKRGYFIEEIEDVSQVLGVSCESFREALTIIRTLNPPGIGWKTLEETLLYQLKEKGICTKNHDTLINEYLEKLATGNTKYISDAMAIDETELDELIQDLKELEPKPSRGFPNNSPKGYVIPDVRIQDLNGKLEITMSTMKIPKLVISQEIRALAKEKDNPEAKKYIDEHIQKALVLMKSIQMRKSTVERITQLLMEHQNDYISEKEEFLRPLSMKQVAEELEIHESTVSRAVRGKYACTPRGVLELRQLFSGSMGKDCHDVSTSRIKEMIKELITNEDPKKPLSDQKVTDILNQNRIDIKRRTVAKYRDELDFPTAKLRKMAGKNKSSSL